MNILREVRKVNQKSMPVRILLLLTFCVMFILTTYAWFIINNQVNLGAIDGDVISWDVSYYVGEDEILDEVVTFTLDQMYPGMPEYTDTVHIYNKSESSTEIECQILSVKLFGEEVLDEIDIKVSSLEDGGKTYSIFSEDTEYPFNVSCSFDKSPISGNFVDEDTTPEAHSKFWINADWTYRAENSDDLTARDDLDTQFGEAAYEYYNQSGGDSALEIQIGITSSIKEETNS